MPLVRAPRVAGAGAAAPRAGPLTFWATGGSRAPASALTPPRPANPPTGAPATAADGAVTAPRPSRTIRARDASPAAAVTPTASAPTRLRIPRLDASLPVRPVGLDADGALELPESPSRAGWYRFGPAPGGGRGATVVSAHVDAPGEGRGPLAGLVRLRPGDRIDLEVGGGPREYRVTKVLRIDKGELDVDAVFSRSGPERLHVVSCGGRFNRDTRHYEDNVIAIAVPADGS